MSVKLNWNITRMECKEKVNNDKNFIPRPLEYNQNGM